MDYLFYFLYMYCSFNQQPPAEMDQREIDEIAAWLAQEKVCLSSALFYLQSNYLFLFNSLYTLLIR